MPPAATFHRRKSPRTRQPGTCRPHGYSWVRKGAGRGWINERSPPLTSPTRPKHRDTEHASAGSKPGHPFNRSLAPADLVQATRWRRCHGGAPAERVVGRAMLVGGDHVPYPPRRTTQLHAPRPSKTPKSCCAAQDRRRCLTSASRHTRRPRHPPCPPACTGGKMREQPPPHPPIRPKHKNGARASAGEEPFVPPDGSPPYGDAVRVTQRPHRHAARGGVGRRRPGSSGSMEAGTPPTSHPTPDRGPRGRIMVGAPRFTARCPRGSRASAADASVPGLGGWTGGDWGPVRAGAVPFYAGKLLDKMGQCPIDRPALCFEFKFSTQNISARQIGTKKQ